MLDKRVLDILLRSIEGNLGLTVDDEEAVVSMAEQAERERTAVSRPFPTPEGDVELTVFSYRRGSVCAALGVVEVSGDDLEDPDYLLTDGPPSPGGP